MKKKRHKQQFFFILWIYKKNVSCGNGSLVKRSRRRPFTPEAVGSIPPGVTRGFFSIQPV